MNTTQLITVIGFLLGVLYKIYKEITNSIKEQNTINAGVIEQLAKLNEEQNWQNRTAKAHDKRITKLEEK